MSFQKKMALNPTAIGKHFGLAPNRINSILRELGFIEESMDGWKATGLGKAVGGTTQIHTISGKPYVLWPNSILMNKDLIVATKSSVERVTDGSLKINNACNFRSAYPAAYRSRDGHMVRSKSEVIIDDWLYTTGLVHAYERKLPVEENVVSDFYIPSGYGRPRAVFIEYWGLERAKDYAARKRDKIAVYLKNGLSLVELNEKDIQSLDDVLPRKLLEFGVRIA